MEEDKSLDTRVAVSFRLFVYYCAAGGAASGLLGWMIGSLASGANILLAAAVRGLCLGACLALALALLDTIGNFSLRQSSLLVQRLVACGVIGGAGGFFASLLGQVIQGAVPWLGAIIGWTLAGTALGAAPGLFDLLLCLGNNQDVRGSRRKVVAGLTGGAIGGLAGGLLYLCLRGLTLAIFSRKPVEKLWSPDASGLAVVGAMLGLLIALALVHGREAWLRIEQGATSGRELILSRPLLILGGADGCDIGLSEDRAVEQVHARLERQGRHYVLSDAGTEKGTFVNGERLAEPRLLRAGDLIQVGGSQLRYSEWRR
jgi:hypothetical protein